jgi:BioD-like phosphotransacetylase family protein
MGAVAADIGGLILSFAPGYGTLGAGITGIASTALNTVADFTDPSMTKGEARKNLVINAGLTVAGTLPGGNSLKIVKGLIRTIPTVFVALNTYNIAASPEIRKSLVKGLDAAKKGDISVLTPGDLKNIVYAL